MTSLPAALLTDIETSGYYPDLVADVLDAALGGEPVTAHLVHVETTFANQIQRHLTALALTGSRLLLAHVDDRGADEGAPDAAGAASVHAVALNTVGAVALTYGVDHPERYRSGDLPAEVHLAISWGAVRRVDLEPANCSDPECVVDHGLTGTIVPDDVVLRLAADVDGADAVRQAIAFARALSAASVAHRGWAGAHR